MMETVSRPWAPFLVGVAVGVAVTAYMFVRAIHLRPPSLQNAWEHEGTVETYVARFRHYNWRWSVVVGGPVALGAVVWILWFLLTLAAGMGGA